MPHAEPKEPIRFDRVPIEFTPKNLAAIDTAAIAIRQARGSFASRREIVNRLIERADMKALVEELSR